MRGRARRVIYGVLKCTGSQRLKPSWRHSRDSALPCCCNMLHTDLTLTALAIALSSLISALLPRWIYSSLTFARVPKFCSEVIRNLRRENEALKTSSI